MIGLVVALIVAVLAAVAVLLALFPSALPIIGVEVGLLAIMIPLIPLAMRKRQAANQKTSDVPKRSFDWWDFIFVSSIIIGAVVFFSSTIAYAVGTYAAPNADNYIGFRNLSFQGSRPILTSHKSWSDATTKHDMSYALSGGQKISSTFTVPPSHLQRFVGGGVELSKSATNCEAASLHYVLSSDKGIISTRTLRPGDKQPFGYRSADHTSHITFASQLNAPSQCRLQLILDNPAVHTLPMWLGWLYQPDLKS